MLPSADVISATASEMEVSIDIANIHSKHAFVFIYSFTSYKKSFVIISHLYALISCNIIEMNATLKLDASASHAEKAWEFSLSV